MSEFNKESLSALLDNETDELELRRLLKEIEQDPELLQTWERLNLVQAILHDENIQHAERLAPLADNFAERIANAIADEPSPAAKSSHQGLGQWGKSLTKLAIAASVALAFFLGMQTTLIERDLSDSSIMPVAQQAELNESENIADSAGGNSDVLLAESPVSEVDPEARQRLEEYIRSVSIDPEEPPQLEQLQDSPLYRLVNEIQGNQ